MILVVFGAVCAIVGMVIGRLIIGCIERRKKKPRFRLGPVPRYGPEPCHDPYAYDQTVYACWTKHTPPKPKARD